MKNESSRIGKEEILRQNKDNKLFVDVLKFVFNPYIVTGISTKKLNKKVKKPEHAYVVPLSLDGMISYLKLNNTGRDIDIFIVQRYLNTYESDDERELLKQIITKNLKVGITSKTINKVLGKNTIPEFGVMLAESYEKKESKLTGEFYITLKLDGNRCLAIKEDGKTKFFTRTGQQIDGMNQLENEFDKLPNNSVYDGEILLVNKDNLPSDELFRATQKVIRKDGKKENLEFHVFDMLSISEFKNGQSKKKYNQRRNTLELAFGKIDKMSFIKLLPILYNGSDKNMVSVLMKWAEENNYEGLMVNTADGLYKNKRTSDLLKVKKFKSADLLVMSIEKAIDGQFKDLLSRVNVEFRGNLVGVGSGFTVEERKKFIENPDLIAGKIIEVQYFEESKDEKTGQPSLRFPVFKGIRHDKGVEDINYEI